MSGSPTLKRLVHKNHLMLVRLLEDIASGWRASRTMERYPQFTMHLTAHQLAEEVALEQALGGASVAHRRRISTLCVLHNVLETLGQEITETVGCNPHQAHALVSAQQFLLAHVISYEEAWLQDIGPGRIDAATWARLYQDCFADVIERKELPLRPAVLSPHAF